MSAVTLTCPNCRQVVTTETPVCPRCGGSVMNELWQARVEALQAVTAKAMRPPPRSGGFSVNGIGTTMLGYEPHGDGTWHATKWFTVSGLPLIPLKSVHLRPLRRENLGMGGHERLLYDVVAEGRPQPRAVLRMYALAVAAAVPGLTYFFWKSMREQLFGKGGLAFFIGLGLIFWFIFMLTRIHDSHKAFKAAEIDPSDGPADGAVSSI